MVRLLTAGLVVFLVACGGSGGGGVSNPTLASLFPIEAQSVGTIYQYDGMRSLIRTVLIRVKAFDLTLEVDRQVDPGPDTHFLGEPGFASGGAAFMWTPRGLELLALFQAQFWGEDGLCVTALSPGLLLVPAGFDPGETHTCNPVGSPLTSIQVSWVGPEAVPGYPNAHRFDLLATGPYSNADPASPRFGGDSVRLIGPVYLAPDVGPVSGLLSYQFLAGATILEDRQYDFTLTSVTPGP